MLTCLFFYFRGPIPLIQERLSEGKWQTDRREFRHKHPGGYMTVWNNEENKARPTVYKDVPDYWTWKHWQP